MIYDSKTTRSGLLNFQIRFLARVFTKNLLLLSILFLLSFSCNLYSCLLHQAGLFSHVVIYGLTGIVNGT